MKMLAILFALFTSAQVFALPTSMLKPDNMVAQQLDVIGWSVKEYPAKEAGNVRILVTVIVDTASGNCFLRNTKLNLLKSKNDEGYVLTPFGFYQISDTCQLVEVGKSSIRYLLTTIEYDPNSTSSIIIKGLEAASDINILE